MRGSTERDAVRTRSGWPSSEQSRRERDTLRARLRAWDGKIGAASAGYDAIFRRDWSSVRDCAGRITDDERGRQPLVAP